MKTYARYVLTALFIFTGVAHFASPETFVRLVPPYLPDPELLNWIAGAAEIAGAVGLCFARTRKAAAWGLIALLIAVFPANIYMFTDRATLFPTWSEWAVAVRLPVQFLLIYWVYAYA